jgi:hypothetical protein
VTASRPARLALLSALCDVAAAARAQFIERPGDTFDDEELVRAAERAADLVRAIGADLHRGDEGSSGFVMSLDPATLIERMKKPEVARALARWLLAAAKASPEMP